MTIQLSLICPMYKVSIYIPELIDSLIAGTNSSSVEIIFVNDCCPEDSLDICRSYLLNKSKAVHFSYTFIDRPTNGGLAAARNSGLSVAKGLFIGFIDSDDLLASNYWSYLSHQISKSHNDIIEFNYTIFYNTLKNIDEVSPNTKEDFSQLSPFKKRFFVWTRIYRRDIINEIFFPEGTLYEDIYFVIHAYSRTKNIQHSSESLIYYRKRDGAITSYRDSRYSDLFINLLNSAKATSTVYQNPKSFISAVSELAFITLLKGLKISNKKEKALFFFRCEQHLAKLVDLKKQHPTLKSTIYTYLSQCVIFIMPKNN